MRARQIVVFVAFLAVMGGLVVARNAFTTKPTPSTTPIVTNVTRDIDASVTTAPPSDWRAAFDRVIAVQNELLQDPNPSRVDEVIDPSCTCAQSTRDGLQSLKDKGWHVQGDFLKPSAVALVSETSSERRITAGFVGGNAPTVDASGKIMEKGQVGALKPVLYVLKKNTKGVWVITERTPYEEQ